MRQPDTTTTSNAFHFITILMKAFTQIPTIPFKNITNQLTIQNLRGIDFNNIIIQLDLRYMEILSTTYQERKKSFTDLFELSETYEKQVEHLLIHNYDIRIAERKNDRSMQNTKLVDFLEGSLHSTKDYLLAVQSIIGISEINTYLKKNILITPMDFPGQKNIRRAIIHRMTNGEQSNIPSQILNIIPFISPLHVSLNSRETVFLINYDFFKKCIMQYLVHVKFLLKNPNHIGSIFF